MLHDPSVVSKGPTGTVTSSGLLGRRLCVFLWTLGTLGICAPRVQAEGSRDLFPSGASGHRGSIEWRSSFSNRFRRRTLLRVFANQGEYILMGSSAVGFDLGDIEVFDPGTVTGPVGNEVMPAIANFTCSTDQPGRGTITHRTQELAGPTSIDGTGNTNGYTPCYYAAPVTGIYFVAIYGPSGRNSDLSPNLAVENNIEAISTGGNQRTGISAWDVTIRDRIDATTDKTGRLHTFNLAINMGRNQVYLHSQVYPITLDGYRYRIDLNGIDPFGFTMFGNQLGNLDSDGRTPLYHDIVGSDRNISNPLGGVVSASPQYPLFFNTIDPGVLSALPVYDPYSGSQTGTGIPISPILPEVQAASFVGNLTGSTSSVGAGGTFYFDSNLPSGTYEIILSQDGSNFDPYAPENKVLRGFMSAPGLQAAPWDGFNNRGGPFLSGTFTYAIEIRGGEYHFPMSDVENNPTGGPVYHLLNATNPRGNNVGFYDHRGYYTLEGELVSDRDPTDGDPTDDPLCGNGPPLAPSSNLATGSNTAAPGYNVFGSATDPGNTNSLCTGSFGDTKTLDLWTYFPSEPPPNTLITIVPSDFGDAPDPSSANATGDYDTLAQNNGPVHALLTTLVRLGDGVTEDINGFVEGIDDQGNASDDSDDGFVTLSAPPLRGSYHLEDIPVNNETNDNATLHGWIDFNRNGRFEPEEHTSAVVIPGETLTDLSWTVPSTVSAGESYARFRITTSQLTDKPATPQLDERSVGVATDGEVEDYPIRLFSVESSPHVLLVKRITAIGAHRNTNPNDGTALNQFVDNTAGPRAEDDNHSYWPENFLIGALNGGKARPASRGTAAEAADEIEYTLYFLSVGGATARGVLLCDRIPANTTLLPDAYRNGPPADPLGTQPNALTLALNFQGNEVALTGADDGDAGYYFPAGVDPKTLFSNINCGGANETGAVVVDLGDLPPATGPATPNNAYGALRFRVQVQ